jgi:hypothetical protein
MGLLFNEFFYVFDLQAARFIYQEKTCEITTTEQVRATQHVVRYGEGTVRLRVRVR